jgi:hypothetical protein
VNARPDRGGGRRYDGRRGLDTSHQYQTKQSPTPSKPVPAKAISSSHHGQHTTTRASYHAPVGPARPGHGSRDR